MATSNSSWTIVAVGYAIMLAWPVSTLALISFGLRYVASHRQHPLPGQPGPYPEHFWIIVPALNEELVVGNTVNAALSLGGPGDTPTRVLVVDDGSDDRTPEVLAGIDHPRLHVLRRELPEARQGKGEALNAAYRFISELIAAEGVAGENVVIGTIDGDGQGSANLLLEVARMMKDPRVGAVQVRVRIRNRHKILGAVQDLEFGAIVNACQSLRDSLDTVGLGGNGQFTRLSALCRLGDSPWSACLVEDLELGLRMHLDGVGIRYTARAVVTQQAVVDIRRLTRQRTRWAQGNLQCARYLGRLITSPKVRPTALLEVLHYLIAPWLNALVTVLLAGGVTVAIAGLLLGAALVYPAFLLLGLVATYRAIVRQARGRQAWAKTERLMEEPLMEEPPQAPLEVALAA